MTQLIAEKPVFYCNRTRRAGEVFSASPAHAALLLKTGLVKVHDAEEEPPASVEASPARARRQYRRRDMRAEA